MKGMCGAGDHIALEKVMEQQHYRLHGDYIFNTHLYLRALIMIKAYLFRTVSFLYKILEKLV
jgi:hypothetical protein